MRMSQSNPESKSNTESNKSINSFYSMDDFVSELKKNENKIVKYHGYDIMIDHHKGNIYMSFITGGEECIGVDFIQMVF